LADCKERVSNILRKTGVHSPCLDSNSAQSVSPTAIGYWKCVWMEIRIPPKVLVLLWGALRSLPRSVVETWDFVLYRWPLVQFFQRGVCSHEDHRGDRIARSSQQLVSKQKSDCVAISWCSSSSRQDLLQLRLCRSTCLALRCRTKRRCWSFSLAFACRANQALADRCN